MGIPGNFLLEEREEGEVKCQPMPLRGQMMTMRQGPTDEKVLERAVDAMIEAGMNLLVIEVEKGVRYDSHPGVSAEWALEKKTLSRLLRRAREGGIECVPLLPSLSHSGYLVAAYPEIAEGHQAGIICPRQEKSQRVVDDLAGELIDLFEPVFFHIAQDELLNSFYVQERLTVLQCETCRGDAGAEWFLDHVLRRYHFLRSRGIEVMMWADMLMDPADFGHGSFCQSGLYGGPPDHCERIIDRLPRDIILCDWHYEPAREFPSLRYLQDKGFRLLGCPNFRENSYLFTRYARRTRTPLLMGMMGTNWTLLSGEEGDVVLRKIRDNGLFFGGGEDPELEERAERAEARSFTEGEFTHCLEFSRHGKGVLESAGWMSFKTYEPSSAGESALSLQAGRKGKIFLPFVAAPGCFFRRFKTVIDHASIADGRVGVSLDGGRETVFRPLAREIDWSDIVSGHGRLLFQVEATNMGKPGTRAEILSSFTGSGEVTNARDFHG